MRLTAAVCAGVVLGVVICSTVTRNPEQPLCAAQVIAPETCTVHTTICPDALVVMSCSGQIVPLTAGWVVR